MRSASIQFGWFSEAEARFMHDRMPKGGDTYGDRVALLNRATRNTSTAAERLAARVYNLKHGRRRVLVKISCSLCGIFMGIVDVPTPEQLKAKVSDMQKEKGLSMTNSALLGMAQSMLPMLPPNAYELITDAMPHTCPACCREYQLTGGQPEDASNGSGISDSESEAPGSGERSSPSTGGGEGLFG